jgi:hypothetical protein
MFNAVLQPVLLRRTGRPGSHRRVRDLLRAGRICLFNGVLLLNGIPKDWGGEVVVSCGEAGGYPDALVILARFHSVRCG